MLTLEPGSRVGEFETFQNSDRRGQRHLDKKASSKNKVRHRKDHLRAGAPLPRQVNRGWGERQSEGSTAAVGLGRIAYTAKLQPVAVREVLAVE